MAAGLIPLGASALGFNVAAGTIGGFIATGIGTVIDSYLIPALQGNPDAQMGPRLTNIQGFRGQEGLPVLRLWGKQRVGAQALWRERKFTEITNTQRMRLGKGRTQETITYSYRISFAVAFCEGGPGTKLLGLEMNNCPVDLEWETRNSGTVKGGGNFEFFPGTESQPVSTIMYQRAREDWVEAGNEEADFPGVPAYRGLCYMVFEDLVLDTFHNRIPVVRARILRPSLGRAFLFDTGTEPQEGEVNGESELPDWQTRTQLLTLGPGYGESVYEPGALRGDDGRGNGLNFNARLSATEGDVVPALDQMDSAFPNAQGLNVPVTWFRTTEGEVKPGVEVKNRLLITQPWSVSGLERDSDNAVVVSGVGGTPSDSSIFNFIKYLLASGSDVELTCRVLNTDGSPVEEPVVFGNVQVGDFEVNAETSSLVYNGDEADFGYRRMVLHYANLLRLARLTANPQQRRIALLRPNGAQEFEMREPRVSGLWIGDSMRGTTHHISEFEAAPASARSFLPFYGFGEWEEPPTTQRGGRRDPPVERPDPLTTALTDFLPNIGGFALDEGLGGQRPGFHSFALFLNRVDYRNAPENLFAVEFDDAGNITRQLPFTDFRPLQTLEVNPRVYVYDPGWQDRSAVGVGSVGSTTPIFLDRGRLWTVQRITPTTETSTYRSFQGAASMGFLLRDTIEATGLSRNEVGYIARGDEYHSAQFPETGPIDQRFVYFNMNWIWRETNRIGVRADLPYSNFRDETNYNASALQFRSGEYWEYVYANEADRATDTRTSILPAVESSRVSHLPAELLPINYNPFLGWKNIRYWQRHNHSIEDWEQPDGSRQGRLLSGLANGLRNHSLEVFLSCRAVDKATNSPRGDLPPFSSGARDDLVQSPYFEAAFAHFAQLTRRIYIEGWDARPEEVIRRSDLWADAGRWATSDSLVRRTSPAALSATLLEVMRASGLEDSQISVNLAQSVAPFIGYSAQGGQSGRDVIAPLLQAYAQNAYESGGQIVVKPKEASDILVVDINDLVPTEDLPEGFRVTHEADSQVQSSIRVSYYDANGDEIASVPVYLPHRRPGREATTSFTLVMGEAHARAVGQVALREGEIAAERWQLNLLPEYSAIEPSDIIELNNPQRTRILVTGIERGDFLQIEGHKAEPAIYEARRLG